MTIPTVQEVEDFKVDLDDAAAIVNGSTTVTTRTGGDKESLDQLLSKIVVGDVTVYSAAATYTLISDWVEESGVVYRPLPSELPIGPETFDGNKWSVVQGYANSSSETFVDGVDYTAGTSTTLTLAGDAGIKANTIVHFDGAFQAQNTYSLSSGTVTFTSAIPVGTDEVYIWYGTSLLTNYGDASSVTLTVGGAGTNVSDYLNSVDVADYTALAALAGADLIDGRTVNVTDDGIRGSFTIFYVVAHGITTTAGVQIRITDDYYAVRSDWDGVTIKPEWWGTPAVNWMIDILTEFTTDDPLVIELSGTYPENQTDYNSTYIAKNNLTLRGVGGSVKPNSTASALEGGAIIQGRFNVFADNFAVEGSVGFDCGQDWKDANYPAGNLAGADLRGGTWDAFAFAQPNFGSPLSQRANFNITGEIIGLCCTSATVGHSMLMEGYDGGFISRAVGIYGVHGAVVKAQNVKIGTLEGYMTGLEDVIFKSDSYSACGHLTVDKIISRKLHPLVPSPHSAPTGTAYGLMFNPATASITGPIIIGNYTTFGSGRGIYCTGDAAYRCDDVQLGNVTINGFSGTMVHGIDKYLCHATGWQIGNIKIYNSQNGISWDCQISDVGNPQITISSSQLANISNIGLSAVEYGRIRINNSEMSVVNIAYNCANDARILIGSETLIAVTAQFNGYTPALGSGWTDFGSGNSTFNLSFKNFGVAIKGLELSDGTSGTLISALPVYLRPTESLRFPSYLNNGAITYAMLGVDAASGNVVINDNTAPANTNYISIDGIEWRNW